MMPPASAPPSDSAHVLPAFVKLAVPASRILLMSTTVNDVADLVAAWRSSAQLWGHSHCQVLHLDCSSPYKEKDIMLYDRIAFEKHIYVATKAERIQNSKHWILHDKCRRTSATTQSTTLLCSSEKRMQTTARRAPGKDSARLQNHPSQTTSLTKKRTTVRRNRRIRLHG